MQSVNKHKNSPEIGSPEKKQEFVDFCQQWKNAESPDQFDKLTDKFQDWISERDSRRKYLQPWFDWWWKRRTNWVTAYRDLGIPESNLQENTNSKYRQSTGLKGLTLGKLSN